MQLELSAAVRVELVVEGHDHAHELACVDRVRALHQQPFRHRAVLLEDHHEEPEPLVETDGATPIGVERHHDGLRLGAVRGDRLADLIELQVTAAIHVRQVEHLNAGLLEGLGHGKGGR